MSVFRKLCTLIYFLASIVVVGALACHYFNVEPIASFMTRHRTTQWFTYVVLALLAILLIGLLIQLLRILFARSKGKFQQTDNELGSITISRSTIEHAAQDVIEGHPEIRHIKTLVKINNHGKTPYVNITARVAPRGLISIAELAPLLQREVKERVETLTGNLVDKVVIDVHENHDPDDVMSDVERDAAIKRLAAAGLSTQVPTVQDGDGSDWRVSQDYTQAAYSQPNTDPHSYVEGDYGAPVYDTLPTPDATTEVLDVPAYESADEGYAAAAADPYSDQTSANAYQTTFDNQANTDGIDTYVFDADANAAATDMADAELQEPQA